jgi:hypothetical protein
MVPLVIPETPLKVMLLAVSLEIVWLKVKVNCVEVLDVPPSAVTLLKVTATGSMGGGG